MKQISKIRNRHIEDSNDCVVSSPWAKDQPMVIMLSKRGEDSTSPGIPPHTNIVSPNSLSENTKNSTSSTFIVTDTGIQVYEQFKVCVMLGMNGDRGEGEVSLVIVWPVAGQLDHAVTREAACG